MKKITAAISLCLLVPVLASATVFIRRAGHTDYTGTLTCVWLMTSDGTETDVAGDEDLTESGSDDIPTNADDPFTSSSTSRLFAESDDEWLESADGAGDSDITGTAISVGGWFKFSSDTSSDQTVIAKFSASNEQYNLKHDDGADRIEFMLSADGSANTTGYSSSGFAAYGDGDWHHIVGVYNGSNIVIYIDGSTDGSPVNFSSSLYAGDADLRIGQDANGNNEFDGYAYQCFVHAGALTSDQITEIMTYGIKGLQGVY